MKLLVEVKDTKAPVISLNRSSVTVSDRSDLKAKDYIDSVMDIVDGDLLSKTTTKITKDKIIYEVADKYGIKARKTLDIHIEKPKSDKAENVPKTEIPQKDTMTQQKQESTPIEKDVPVTAQSRSFPFVEGRSFDQTYQECMAAGNAAVSAGQANTASCTVYDDENGIHKGYDLNFD